jgi:hypothetical protein
LSAPSYSTGDVPTATEVNEFLTNVHFVRRTSDATRTSTTTFTDDSQLSLAVEANAIYVAKVGLLFASTSQAAGDFKAQFTAPASAVGWWSIHGNSASGTAATDDYGGVMTLNSASSSGVIATAEPWNMTMYDGLLVTAGTSGNFVVQWAQNTSSGTGTTLKINSFIWLYRVS